MNNRRYYSTRTGKNQNAQRFDTSFLKRLFRDLYIGFDEMGYFQEGFGYDCVDQGRVAGTLGSDIDAQFFRIIRKQSLWPIKENCLKYSEDDVFDVVEFLYDHISKPIEGNYHSYGQCGWHYYSFDKNAGQREYRNEINSILADYSVGYELSDNGEILELPERGLENLIEANLPLYDPENVEERVASAITKFRRYHSTLDERRDAIRDLGDVLEFLRPKAKEVLLSRDESDLFNIANNFGIRHHNSDQKTDYDKPIWYSWMFYYYLSTIHACLRLINKAKDNKKA